MKKITTISISIIVLLILISQACKDEELPKPKNTQTNKIELTITEDSTSYVFSELTCSLNQQANFEIKQYGFCWDTVANVNIENTNNSFENLISQNFTKNIEDLLPNKTYYVKAYIQTGNVIIYSNEITIQTLDARPIVTTSNIINIIANSAESGGETEAYDTLFPITQRGVCWAKTTKPTIKDSLTTDSTGNGTFTSQIKNLDIGTKYYIRAYSINSEGITYGEEKSFSTLDGIPELKTDSIKNITANSATFYGNIIENDGLEILEKGFCWNTSTNPTIDNNIVKITGDTLGSFSKNITNLDVNTTYYVKVYIKNSTGTFYANEISFTTKTGIPTLSTTEITNITATSSTSGGNITDNGGDVITNRGICWSTSQSPTITGTHTTDGSGTGSFSSNLTELGINTTYYVRAYTTNSIGTFYGDELSFTTKDGIPSITTTEITNITATTATSGGNISDDGGLAVTARGVCWSISTNPIITDTHTNDGTETGSFTSSLTGLDVNTTYYMRAYATNETGTVYGNKISFTTNDGIPNLTTTEIKYITATTATSGGNITDDGGDAITARGVCWSTSSNPTISGTHTTDGTGTGSFTSSLTGLTGSTTYYIRAYATNSIGTRYGNQISFLTCLKDIDGNVYEIVSISNQVWMAENLKTTHYADGTEIPLITDNTTWGNLEDNNADDAYCYYNDNANNESYTYGALYTWAAAMGDNAVSSSANPSGVQGVCPTGWHLPSDAEWTELINYIANDGHSGAEGTALKATSGWNNDGNGTDDYGFSALPCGHRSNGSGMFSYVGDNGYWWSSTEYDSSSAWYRSLSCGNGGVYRNSSNKSHGFSVRCLRD